MRRKLAQYGLSALLYPAAILPTAGLADDTAGQTASPTLPGTPNEPAPSIFTFGGFGTLGVVHSDQPLADFTSSAVEGVGAGHTHAWSAAVDSLAAAQVGARITPQFSAVLQVLSEQNADSSFSPHVEWAFITYQVTPDFSLRAGRTDLDVFLLTDSRNIGFAFPFVRPPVELYDLVPVTNSDGIDFSYRLPMLGGSSTLDASIGHSLNHYRISDSDATGTANATQLLTLVDTLQRGSMTLKISYGEARLTVPALDPLFDAFREFGSEGIAIANRYDVNARMVRFYGLSADYQPADWFVMAELGRVNYNSVFGEITGWYVTGGHRFGRFTPYATYAQTRPNSSTRAPGLDLSAIPPSQATAAAVLDAGLDTVLARIASQRTSSLGARFDVTSNIDLKFQWDHTNLGSNSQGWLINLQPGFRPGSSFTLVSAMLDFVF